MCCSLQLNAIGCRTSAAGLRLQDFGCRTKNCKVLTTTNNAEILVICPDSSNQTLNGEVITQIIE